MKTKQTAIQWLKEQYIERGETIPLGVFQEALEMEKEQIIDAAYEFMGTNFDSNRGRAKMYYNETYQNK